MQYVYLSLGSNQGDRIATLCKAVDEIEQQIGRVLETSSYYETEPWGFTDDTNFINQVIKIQTNLTPEQILLKSQGIERQLGRKRVLTTQRYSGRTIDIDILFIDDLIINTENLTVPHPHLHERNFVLQPMCEIAPEFVHPIIGNNIKQLTESCDDQMTVNILNVV